MFHVTSPVPFKFALGQRLALTVSGENGQAIARSESVASEPQYLLRYPAADGRAVEAWWSQSALEACDGNSATTAGAGILPPLDPGCCGNGKPAMASLPSVGAQWPAGGGIFAGIARGVDGAPDYLLVLAEAKPADGISWPAAMAWAEGLGQGGVWALPTRAESALLFANLRDQFEPKWYWTSEQSSRDIAWGQDFGGGYQGDFDESYEGRARAVRRLPIQPFNHS